VPYLDPEEGVIDLVLARSVRMAEFYLHCKHINDYNEDQVDHGINAPDSLK
jgi:hypothetical protein